MANQGDAEAQLKDFVQGKSWVAPNLAILRGKLLEARGQLVTRGIDLFGSWNGESSEAARAAASVLVETIATLEQQCADIEKAIDQDDLERRASAESALKKLPKDAIPDSTLRAVLQGATIVNPIGGGLLTMATIALFANQLSEERNRVAQAELSKIESKIDRAANSLVERRTEHIALNERFGKSDFGITEGSESRPPRTATLPWGGPNVCGRDGN
ncbi:hypothetical protein [Mycetocola lacteus]|uniref:hypothetical protein n=1 Tax=Mycetocola lacteus TaxID=76637 RepID=UPI0011C3C981|nr:hypothetical protein [Mycetocola lacteus]